MKNLKRISEQLNPDCEIVITINSDNNIQTQLNKRVGNTDAYEEVFPPEDQPSTYYQLKYLLECQG